MRAVLFLGSGGGICHRKEKMAGLRAVLFRERDGKQASRNFRKTLSLLRLRSGAKFEKTSLSTGVCDVFYSFWMPVLLWSTKESVGAALIVRKHEPAGNF